MAHFAEEPTLLGGVLDNAQIPHSPLVILADNAAVSGVPVIREMISRSLDRNASVLLVTCLHPPAVFLPLYSPKISIVDLSDCVSGFSSEDWSDVRERVIHAFNNLPPGPVEIYLDAPDILAEDYSPPPVLPLMRTLLGSLKDRKPPSRLCISLPHTSPLLASLTSPSLSPALTLLHLHPLPLLSALSTSYLTPITSAPPFWNLLETSSTRNQAEDIAFRGDLFDVGDWTAGTSSPGAGPSKGGVGAMGISVLVRKATGGAKAISRSLEAISPAVSPSSAGAAHLRLDVAPLEDFSSPLSAPMGKSPSAAPEKTGGTHQELGLSFNLNLTDEQRKRRGEVPLPYAHEGEGVELGWEDEEDDEDDEEI